MRAAFLLLAIIFVSGLKAQMCPCEFGSSGKVRRHELGISLISSIGEPGKYRVVDAAISGTLLSGINYKYHMNNFSFRASAAYKPYMVDDSLDTGVPLFNEWTVGKAHFYEMRAGIEKTIIPGKWRLYIAADVLYGFGKADGDQYKRNDLNTTYQAKINYTGISLLPGLNFRPKERWSINLEPCFNITSNNQRSNIGNSSFIRTYILLNTLSFNLHF